MEKSTVSDEQEDHVLELAASVAKQVKIKRVVLADCKAIRSPSAESNEDETDIEIKIDIREIEFGKDDDTGVFHVKPHFVLRAIKQGSPEISQLFSIEASFVIVYSLDSLQSFSKEHIKAFAETNGIFNAWPYWRELVQSLTSRMGLPALTVPVYRVG